MGILRMHYRRSEGVSGVLRSLTGRKILGDFRGPAVFVTFWITAFSVDPMTYDNQVMHINAMT